MGPGNRLAPFFMLIPHTEEGRPFTTEWPPTGTRLIGGQNPKKLA